MNKTEASEFEALAEFKSAVKTHLSRMNESEFQAWRYFGEVVEASESVDPEFTRASLAKDAFVDLATTIDTLDIADLLKIKAFGLEAVGQTKSGDPLYFAKRSGFYVSPVVKGSTAQLWLTHPAYPKHW